MVSAAYRTETFLIIAFLANSVKQMHLLCYTLFYQSQKLYATAKYFSFENV